jgi:murein DD-endopeptidase MepM/ murein hydrolase activator NlpD
MLAPPTPRAQPATDTALPRNDAEHAAAGAASRSQIRPQLVWPAPGAITSVFGERRGASFHPGIDIDGVTGDPVVAAFGGTVTGAGPPPVGYSGYGTIVAIDHGNGMDTLYAHLSRVEVATGQVVQAGQLIGAIGMTGVATGDHLHFEVRVADVPVDPMLWLGPRPAPPPVVAPPPVPAPSAPVDQPRLQSPHAV